MPDKEERLKELEKTEFPVDARPLIGSFLLLFLVFIGLCVIVYFENSSQSSGLGIVLLALAFGFAAYVQRTDSFRVVAILGGGAVICFFVYVFGGGTDEPIDQPGPRKNPKTLSLTSPEGLGE